MPESEQKNEGTEKKLGLVQESDILYYIKRYERTLNPNELVAAEIVLKTLQYRRNA